MIISIKLILLYNRLHLTSSIQHDAIKLRVVKERDEGRAKVYDKVVSIVELYIYNAKALFSLSVITYIVIISRLQYTGCSCIIL